MNTLITQINKAPPNMPKEICLKYLEINFYPQWHLIIYCRLEINFLTGQNLDINNALGTSLERNPVEKL